MASLVPPIVTPSPTHLHSEEGIETMEEGIKAIYPHASKDTLKKLVKLICDLENRAKWEKNLLALAKELEKDPYGGGKLAHLRIALERTDEKISSIMSAIDLIEQRLLFSDRSPKQQKITMHTKHLPPLLRKITTPVDPHEETLTPKIATEKKSQF